jgi:hypothetical protein
MKYFMVAIAALLLLSVTSYTAEQKPKARSAAEQKPKIKRLNDPDFLLLVQNSTALSETLISNVRAKFFVFSEEGPCVKAGNPVVAFLLFANADNCAVLQLIRLPESTRWEMNIWKPKTESTVAAHLVREYNSGGVPVIEEWEVSGNGKTYEITKFQSD